MNSRAGGVLTDVTQRRLARTAFAQTAAYDAAIVTWLDESSAADDAGDDGALPSSIHLALELAQPLRYGENPHQQGARYRQAGATSWWDSMTQHGGKELSYLNVFDTEAAWRLVHRFDAPAVVVVKHANPCGVAVADDITEAYVRANACDPVSAFGGIIAANRTVTAEMATAIGDVFTEVVVAPDFEPEALEILAVKKNLRVMSANAASPLPFDVRPVDGGLLVQQPDPVAGRTDEWRVVTAAQPSDAPVGRPRVRLAGVRGGQQQRDRLRQGPAGVRHRCRPAEPARLGPHRRRTLGRPGDGRRLRERRVLPVPRRPRRRCGRRASPR